MPAAVLAGLDQAVGVASEAGVLVRVVVALLRAAAVLAAGVRILPRLGRRLRPAAPAISAVLAGSAVDSVVQVDRAVGVPAAGVFASRPSPGRACRRIR